MSSKSQKHKSKQNKLEAVSASSESGIAKNEDNIESKSADKKILTKKAGTKKTTNDMSLKKIIQQTGSFLREAKSELQKVKWPTKKELISSTIVVVVLSLIVGAYLGLLDLVLVKIVTLVVG